MGGRINWNDNHLSLKLGLGLGAKLGNIIVADDNKVKVCSIKLALKTVQSNLSAWLTFEKLRIITIIFVGIIFKVDC